MRIVTWNMQGGTNAMYVAQVIAHTQPNVLCLQETGNLSALLQGAAAFPGFPGSVTGNFAAGHDFFECVYWHNAGWVQGGVAIMSNIGMVNHGIMAAVGAPYVPPIPRALPWVEVTNPTTGANIRIFSIHGPPVFGPVTLANVCAWDNAQVAAVAGVAPATWAIAGDFNADPTAVGYAAPAAGAVVHGNRATQQGAGLLDYAVTNAGAGFTFVAASELVGASDHYPQEFNL